MLVLRIFNLAEHRALVQPEHIRRAEHDAAGGKRGPDLVRDKDALQNQQLANESIQRRQTDR
jgi:hypothetical protein